MFAQPAAALQSFATGFFNCSNFVTVAVGEPQGHNMPMISELAEPAVEFDYFHVPIITLTHLLVNANVLQLQDRQFDVALVDRETLLHWHQDQPVLRHLVHDAGVVENHSRLPDIANANFDNSDRAKNVCACV